MDNSLIVQLIQVFATLLAVVYIGAKIFGALMSRSYTPLMVVQCIIATLVPVLIGVVLNSIFNEVQSADTAAVPQAVIQLFMDCVGNAIGSDGVVPGDKLILAGAVISRDIWNGIVSSGLLAIFLGAWAISLLLKWVKEAPIVDIYLDILGITLALSIFAGPFGTKSSMWVLETGGTMAREISSNLDHAFTFSYISKKPINWTPSELERARASVKVDPSIAPICQAYMTALGLNVNKPDYIGNLLKVPPATDRYYTVLQDREHPSPSAGKVLEVDALVSSISLPNAAKGRVIVCTDSHLEQFLLKLLCVDGIPSRGMREGFVPTLVVVIPLSPSYNVASDAQKAFIEVNDLIMKELNSGIDSANLDLKNAKDALTIKAAKATVDNLTLLKAKYQKALLRLKVPSYQELDNRGTDYLIAVAQTSTDLNTLVKTSIINRFSPPRFTLSDYTQVLVSHTASDGNALAGLLFGGKTGENRWPKADKDATGSFNVGPYPATPDAKANYWFSSPGVQADLGPIKSSSNKGSPIEGAMMFMIEVVTNSPLLLASIIIKTVLTILIPPVKILGCLLVAMGLFLVIVSHPVISLMMLWPGNLMMYLDWAKGCFWVCTWVPIIALGIKLCTITGGIIPGGGTITQADVWLTAGYDTMAMVFFGIIMVLASPMIANFIFNPGIGGLSSMTGALSQAISKTAGAAVTGGAALTGAGLGALKAAGSQSVTEAGAAVNTPGAGSASSGEGALTRSGSPNVGAPGVGGGLFSTASTRLAQSATSTTESLTRGGASLGESLGGLLGRAGANVGRGLGAGAGALAALPVSTAMKQGAGMASMAQEMLGSDNQVPLQDRVAQGLAKGMEGNVMEGQNLARGKGRTVSAADFKPASRQSAAPGGSGPTSGSASGEQEVTSSGSAGGSAGGNAAGASAAGGGNPAATPGRSEQFRQAAQKARASAREQPPGSPLVADAALQEAKNNASQSPSKHAKASHAALESALASRQPTAIAQAMDEAHQAAERIANEPATEENEKTQAQLLGAMAAASGSLTQAAPNGRMVSPVRGAPARAAAADQAEQSLKEAASPTATPEEALAAGTKALVQAQRSGSPPLVQKAARSLGQQLAKNRAQGISGPAMSQAAEAYHGAMVSQSGTETGPTAGEAEVATMASASAAGKAYQEHSGKAAVALAERQQPEQRENAVLQELGQTHASNAFAAAAESRQPVLMVQAAKQSVAMAQQGTTLKGNAPATPKVQAAAAEQLVQVARGCDSMADQVEENANTSERQGEDPKHITTMRTQVAGLRAAATSARGQSVDLALRARANSHDVEKSNAKEGPQMAEIRERMLAILPDQA